MTPRPPLLPAIIITALVLLCAAAFIVPTVQAGTTISQGDFIDSPRPCVIGLLNGDQAYIPKQCGRPGDPITISGEPIGTAATTSRHPAVAAVKPGRPRP